MCERHNKCCNMAHSLVSRRIKWIHLTSKFPHSRSETPILFRGVLDFYYFCSQSLNELFRIAIGAPQETEMWAFYSPLFTIYKLGESINISDGYCRARMTICYKSLPHCIEMKRVYLPRRHSLFCYCTVHKCKSYFQDSGGAFEGSKKFWSFCA